MIFYRRLSHISAISFDLDDTLYANSPIMKCAEDKMQQYFHHNEKICCSTPLNQHFWQPFKAKAIEINPIIAHDVVALRQKSYFLGFCSLGFSTAQAQTQAQQAMDYFSHVRSNFTLPEHTHQFLTELQQYFPLIAITNGNVDTKVIGINHYFKHIYHAVNGIKQKPNRDMFDHACQQLAINNNQLLHVGDCGHADIQGAINAGCQAAWINSKGPGKALTVLPHIELTQLNDLLIFCKN